MTLRIFVVEQAARSSVSPGVELSPYFAFDPRDDAGKQAAPAPLRAQPCPVVLRRPNGAELACTLRIGSWHVSPVNYSDPHWYSLYWLPDIEPDQVPSSTEIWVEEAELLSPAEIRAQEDAFLREMAEREGA